jgi:hypothetical protein
LNESSLWCPCRFGGDGLAECPNVHDNFVYALSVHLEKRLLVLQTQYRDGSGPPTLTDLRFVGLVAHHFDDVAEPSILLDIEEVPPGWVVEQWGELFDRRKNHGWPPIQYVDRSELVNKLVSQGVHGYRVMGTCGLDGFVLAAGVEYHQRKADA